MNKTSPWTLPPQLLLALALLASSARADEGAAPVSSSSAAPSESATLHRVTVLVENDKFAGTDKFYTNGFKLSYQRDDVGSISTFFSDLISLIPPFKARPLAWGLVLGQDIYTPADTEETRLIPNDRPYGAWFYAGLTLTRGNRPRPGEERPAILFEDRIELLFGAIGEAAQGEEVQNNWHRIINVSLSEGWDNQLKSEVGVQLYLQRKWLIDLWRGEGLLPGADFQPNLGGALGTVFTHLSVGGTFRFGWNLGDVFGPPQRIASAGLAALTPPPDHVRFYVFGRLHGRIVLHNAFIAGGVFRAPVRELSINGVIERHDIDYERFVADFEVGAVLEWRWLQIGLTSVTRTREFDEQPDSFTFGGIHVQLTF